MNKRNQQLVESEIALLTAAKDTAINEIDTFIKSTHEQLEQHRNDLVDHVLDQYNARQKELVTKQEQIEETTRILSDNTNKAKRITKTADLSKLQPISESLRTINETTKLMSSNLNLGENYLAFDSNKGLDELKNCLFTVGQICNRGFLPSMIEFTNTEAKAGHKATLSVNVCDHRGNALSVSSDTLSLQVTDATGAELQTIFCQSSPESTVTFTPQMSGLHKVSGTFLGQELISELTHISVASNNPVLIFGDTEDSDGCLNQPWGIAIDKNNCIYIADTSNQLIQKFTPDGEFLSQFSVSIHNENGTVCDIALDLNKGLVLCPEIADEGDCLRETSNILVFDLQGVYQHTCTVENTWAAFTIAIDQHGDLIISNLKNECLIKVNTEGNFVCRIGPPLYPGYIAINADNSIIVPDEDNDRIYIFNHDGSVRHQFGSTGEGKGQFKRPLGVATDGEYILVSDMNNRVQVFTNNGTFVSIIESTGDPLDNPRGLAVTTDGYVFVVDTFNDCVKKYKYRDMPW